MTTNHMRMSPLIGQMEFVWNHTETTSSKGSWWIHLLLCLRPASATPKTVYWVNGHGSNPECC